MKRLILLVVMAFGLVAFANAQRIYTVTADTLNGNETVNFGAIRSTDAFGLLTIQALCSNIGGTSDGTLILQGSVDGTTYTTVTSTADMFTCFPNDTLTITDAASWQIAIQNSPFNYYRVQGAGTASDSTLITIKYTHRE